MWQSRWPGICSRRATKWPLLRTRWGTRSDDVDIWRYAARTDAIVVTCNRQDFLALAGQAPETGLIVLNRRRTRQAECTHLLRLLANAGEEGLRRNVNFA